MESANIFNFQPYLSYRIFQHPLFAFIISNLKPAQGFSNLMGPFTRSRVCQDLCWRNFRTCFHDLCRKKFGIFYQVGRICPGPGLTFILLWSQFIMSKINLSMKATQWFSYQDSEHRCMNLPAREAAAGRATVDDTSELVKRWLGSAEADVVLMEALVPKAAP